MRYSQVYEGNVEISISYEDAMQQGFVRDESKMCGVLKEEGRGLMALY